MVVKNIQIYCVQVREKWICNSKNLKKTFQLPPGKTLSSVLITDPRQRQIGHSAQ